MQRSNTAECIASPTKINGGQSVCSGEIIFLENFEGLLSDKWQPDVRIPIDSQVIKSF